MNTEQLKYALTARACSPELADEICAQLDRLAELESKPAAQTVAVPDEIETLRKDVTTALDVLAKRTKECEEWKAAAGRFDANNIELRARIKELKAAQTVTVPDAYQKALDAALSFIGDVAPGASWWDDVWPEHEAALSAPATPAKANAGPRPDCPQCGGSGAYYGTSPVCCGRPLGDGECCGNPEPEVVQCACETAQPAKVDDSLSAFLAECSVSQDIDGIDHIELQVDRGVYQSAMLSAQPAKVEDDVARDAARYRFLRMLDWYTGPLCVVRDPQIVFKRGSNLGCDCPSRDRLDAAIDAAMLSAAQAKEGS